MSLLDEVRAVPRRYNGSVCGVAQAVAAMSAEDGADLLAVLADPSIHATAIEEVLKRRGLTVKAYTLNRHRKGGCSCERSS